MMKFEGVALDLGHVDLVSSWLSRWVSQLHQRACAKLICYSAADQIYAALSLKSGGVTGVVLDFAVLHLWNSEI